MFAYSDIHGSLQNLDSGLWIGLDWTGLDWTGLDWTEHAHSERRRIKWIDTKCRSFFFLFVLDIVIISSESEDSYYNGALPGANR